MSKCGMLKVIMSKVEMSNVEMLNVKMLIVEMSKNDRKDHKIGTKSNQKENRDYEFQALALLIR